MKISTISFVIAAAAAAGLSATAQADTLTGRFGYTFLKSINISSPTVNGSVNTVKFNWTRQDAPGAGIEAFIPGQFNSACIEPAQGISPNTNYTFNIVTPEAHGYSPLQVTMLQRLWADHYPAVDHADASAAFQMSVWEIIHDTEVDLGAGLFRVNSNIPATTLAGSWLTSVSSPNYSTINPIPELAVMQSASAQDQITVIPAPAAGVLAGLAFAGLAMCRRRA